MTQSSIEARGAELVARLAYYFDSRFDGEPPKRLPLTRCQIDDLYGAGLLEPETGSNLLTYRGVRVVLQGAP